MKRLSVFFLITCLFCLLIYLGCWQVRRGQEKKILLNQYQERTLQDPLSFKDLHGIATQKDLRFYRIKLQGIFDNAHTFLLDNKTFHGQVGYEIYTPFQIKQLKIAILVDRGFVPLGGSRHILPLIRSIEGEKTILGMLNCFPRYVILKKDSDTLSWPLRVQFIDINTARQTLKYPFLPYVLNLDKESPFSYPIEWQIVTMQPERHFGYALQWFALAITLLILFVTFNRTPKRGAS
jgi:surfeit locus 1 family protein